MGKYVIKVDLKSKEKVVRESGEKVVKELKRRRYRIERESTVAKYIIKVERGSRESNY